VALNIQFDPLEGFSEIEHLVAKIYFRFSHVFLHLPELRDFWWEMAKQEEQHSSILLACKEMIENYSDETLDPTVTQAKAEELRGKLLDFLAKGIPSLTVEEAFKIALDIETSEIDAIYSKLLQLGGPKIGQTLENLGVPASVQRQKLKSAIRQYCKDTELLAAAEQI
jgi:hypothetical protein